MTDEYVAVTEVHAVETTRRGAGEHLDTVTVEASYTYEHAQTGEPEEFEFVTVEYEVKDDRALFKGATARGVDPEGREVDLPGLAPNALRAVPAAEQAVAEHPEVEEVQPAEEAIESCLEIGRSAAGGDGA